MKTLLQSRSTRLVTWLAALLLAAASLTACGDDGAETTNPGTTSGTNGTNTGTTPDYTDPSQGFVSADGFEGQDSSRGDDLESSSNNASAPNSDGGAGGEERTAEEGDIYRVLDQDLILNLNAYRGLQILDVSDPENPEVTGRVQVSGTPVELYVVGQRAFILLNNWYGYYGSRDDVEVEDYYGGLVVVADISDPQNPRITGQAPVPGWIRTSRVTRGNGQESLYVVSNNWSGDSNVVVRSFSVSEQGALVERSTLDLGGYVMDIQATGQHLMVARYDWRNNEDRTLVSLVDISDPNGFMVEGAEVRTAGIVQNKHNMNIYNGVLRIASGAWWNNRETNYIQTWDIADIQNPTPIDEATYGDGERLFATLFLGNKAFCVTYLQVDPFHAFEITDDGYIDEKAEYIISGWNNFFRPVFDDSRLVGIGVDDEQGGAMAVSLYDITDLANPDPFIAREHTPGGGAWGEANWDDRAFSVLEDVVNVTGPNGERETGMVLLPFTTWDSEDGGYTAAVQIFTFSEDSLTARGTMHHGTPVRRSFRANEDVTANLSEAELSLFDTNDPVNPEELGRLELAPNYTDFFVLNGAYGARVKYDADYYGWWRNYGEDVELPETHVEIVALNGDVDTDAPVATFNIPSYAQLHQVGTTLVATQTEAAWDETLAEYTYRSTARAFDLSDPANPQAGGIIETERPLGNGYYGGYGYYDDCWDCGWGWGYYGYSYSNAVAAGDNALVFPNYINHQELLGQEETCYYWPRDEENRYNCTEHDDETGAYSCTYLSGGYQCSSLNGEPELCSGSFEMCTESYDGEEYNYSCTPVEMDDLDLQENCNTYDRYRYWWTFELDVLDVADPQNPVLRPSLDMADNEEGVKLLADGDDVLVSYKVPVQVEDDPRAYVRYFFKRIGLTDPAAPTTGPAVNVPGELMAVDGDTVITKDFHWGENILDTSVNRLTVNGAVATLTGTYRMRDQQVHAIMLDGAGHALVSHRTDWNVARAQGLEWNDVQQTLSIIDIDGDSLRLTGTESIDDWASLAAARQGRAIFNVPGGLLVINVSNPTNPFAQAFFPTRTWWANSLKLNNSTLYLPAGRFGLYSFGLNDFNLLAR